MGPNLLQHHSLFRNGINITSYHSTTIIQICRDDVKDANFMPKSQTHTKYLGTNSLGFLQYRVHYFF